MNGRSERLGRSGQTNKRCRCLHTPFMTLLRPLFPHLPIFYCGAPSRIYVSRHHATLALEHIVACLHALGCSHCLHARRSQFSLASFLLQFSELRMPPLIHSDGIFRLTDTYSTVSRTVACDPSSLDNRPAACSACSQPMNEAKLP